MGFGLDMWVFGVARLRCAEAQLLARLHTARCTGTSPVRISARHPVGGGGGGGGSSLRYGARENGEVLRALVLSQYGFTPINETLYKNKQTSFFLHSILFTFKLGQDPDITALEQLSNLEQEPFSVFIF